MFQPLDDSDHQLSTDSLSVRWFGFTDDVDSVTYRVGLGTSPDSDDSVSLVDVGSTQEYIFTSLNLRAYQVHMKVFIVVHVH